MSDPTPHKNDLVRRLRAYVKALEEGSSPEPELAYASACRMEEAADRIEELEEHKRAQAGDIMTLGMTVGRLEAALREIADTKDSKDLGMDEPECYENQAMIDALIHIARRALEGVAVHTEEIGKTLGEHMSDRRALEGKP